MAHSSSLEELTVKRCEPELIPPSKPTPYEFKYLSDIDDQEFFRCQLPFVQFYRKNEKLNVEDPVRVIKQAVAKTLVYYYPFAGRLRHGPNGKLMVECTGEGVMFIEASANVTIDHFIDVLLPPIPAIDELLYEVPASGGIINCPLLLIQVTRLICGGFTFAIRMNHTMCDAIGLVQFMNAIGEFARRGVATPSVEPVWNRELLMARDPPRVTFVPSGYNENDMPSPEMVPMREDEMVHEPIFFGPKEISSLRNNVPSHLRNCSTFEIVTACIWRTRIIALGTYNATDEVFVGFPVNVRNRMNPPLPVGYYGNALMACAAVAKAGELCEKPLGYALEVVMRAKEDVTDENIRSFVDYLVLNGRPNRKFQGYYGISDVRHIGFGEVDFGWGKPVYGGPANVGFRGRSGLFSYCLSMKNKEGEDGLVATFSLPRLAKEKFEIELDKLMRGLTPEAPLL